MKYCIKCGSKIEEEDGFCESCGYKINISASTVSASVLSIILWILGAVAAYRLWGDAIWLSVVVILLALSYSVYPDEQREHETAGLYSRATGNRLMWTFILVVVIFVYSLFK